MSDKDTQSPLPTPADLARVLRGGVRNAESLAITGPIREAVADRLNSLSRGELVPARAEVPAKEGTQVQFLDRVDLGKEGVFPAMRMTRWVLWWGIHFWGKEAEADEVFNAARWVGLGSHGWPLDRGTGDPYASPDVWGTGGYVRAFRVLTAEQVEELPTLEGLVSQIAADLWWWDQRLKQVKVLASFLKSSDATDLPVVSQPSEEEFALPPVGGIETDTFIKLPYGGPGAGFRVSELVKHIRGTGRDYIIQGGQDVTLAKHTKPNSLDVWLRTRFATNPDTRQTAEEVMNALEATGRFQVVRGLRCPESGRLVNGLRLLDPPR